MKLNLTKLKIINIEGLNNLESEIILKDLKNLNLENIFLLINIKLTKLLIQMH